MIWQKDEESPGNETVGGGAEAERSDAERETGGVLMGDMQAEVTWEQNDEWAADTWAGRA